MTLGKSRLCPGNWKGGFTPFCTSRGSPRYAPHLKRIPKLPITTREKPQHLPSTKMRPNSSAATREQYRVPPRNLKGALTPYFNLRGSPRSSSQLERNPKLLLHLKKNLKMAPHPETKPHYHAATQVKSRGPPWKLKGGLTPFSKLERFPKIPVST